MPTDRSCLICDVREDGTLLHFTEIEVEMDDGQKCRGFMCAECKLLAALTIPKGKNDG